MACEALLEEGWENELGEALFAQSETAEDLVESACSGWSSACKKKAPKVDSARAAGPPFRAYTEQERAQREAQSGSPATPGRFRADELARIFGLPADETLGAAAWEEGAAAGLGRGAAQQDLERDPAFVRIQ